MSESLRLRPDVILGAPLRLGGAVVHYLKDPRTGWYYRLGSREFFLVSRLDGRWTRQDIESAYTDHFGRTLTPASWASLLELLRARRLLVEDPPAGPAALDGAGPADPALDRLRDKAVRQRRTRGLLYARFPLVRPDRFFAWLAPHVGGLYSPWFVLPMLTAAAGAAALAVPDAAELYAAASANAGHPLAFVALAVTWLLIVLHEAAHGLTSRRFGGAVSELGLLWRFPLLTPYCKTDDVVLFARRRHRVYTAFAGVFVNLVAIIGFTGAWRASAPGTRWHALAGALLVYGWLTVATNLLPLFRLDGYFMLSHALGQADLRGETHRFWLALIRRRGTGSYRRTDRWIYGGYGLAMYAAAGALVAGTVTLWFRRLSGWIGPYPAAAVMAGEAATLLLLLGWLLRRRAARRQPGVSGR